MLRWSGPCLPHLTLLSPPPHKDLEQYAASYSGLMRIERLQFIADRCPPLRVEALKMALSFVQRTFNVDMYEEIHRKLSEATRQVSFGGQGRQVTGAGLAMVVLAQHFTCDALIAGENL